MLSEDKNSNHTDTLIKEIKQPKERVRTREESKAR